MSSDVRVGIHEDRADRLRVQDPTLPPCRSGRASVELVGELRALLPSERRRRAPEAIEMLGLFGAQRFTALFVTDSVSEAVHLAAGVIAPKGPGQVIPSWDHAGLRVWLMMLGDLATIGTNPRRWCAVRRLVIMAGVVGVLGFGVMAPARAEAATNPVNLQDCARLMDANGGLIYFHTYNPCVYSTKYFLNELTRARAAHGKDYRWPLVTLNSYYDQALAQALGIWQITYGFASYYAELRVIDRFTMDRLAWQCMAQIEGLYSAACKY